MCSKHFLKMRRENDHSFYKDKVEEEQNHPIPEWPMILEYHNKNIEILNNFS